MSTPDVLQIIISALGILVTIAVIWGGNKRLEGSIEERLRVGDEKFKSIDERCKEHGEELKKLEVDLAVNDRQQSANTANICRVSAHVDNIEGRVTVLESKEK